MEACIILECRSEESPARELSLIHPTKGGKSLQALLPASQSAIACCASELEQDIAALEAEASWEDVHVWDMSVDDTYIAEAPARDQSLDLGQRELSGCHQESDHDSESDRESEDRRAAKVQANAKMVAEYGRPLEHGAWKGCAKSAWCDREDRHRGLCNHKASIPGPAVASIAGTVPYSRYQQHSQVPEDTLDNSCGLYQADDQNGKSLCAVADEHGVCRSAGYTAQLQHSMETSSMQSNCPSDQAVEEHVWREVSSGPELVWSSSASQQQQLLAMPLIYQPLVKDLGAPGIGSFLNSDSLCYLQETLDVPVPVVQPVTQAVHIEAYEVSSRSSNSAEDAFGRQGSSSEPACSAPSSPSCSSEAASILCYDTGSAAQAPGTCSKQPLQESGPLVDAAIPAIGGASSVDCCAKPNVAHGLLPLRKVHPTDCSTAACAIPVITPQPPTTAPAASVPAEKQTLLQRCGSSHSQLSQSSVDGLGRASVTQSAASDCPVTITPAAAVLTAAKSAAEVSAAAHPAAASQAPSMQRTARIKVKPRRADEPPRQLLEPSSPKAKKRMGSRMVSLPSAGHCCTQCGAVSTPVWRAGPAGPKTLCNACGVRYMKVARRSR